MNRARRHQRILSALAFGLIAVLAELVGAGLTHRIDLGRHVRSPGYSHAAYYPAVLAVVKVGIALLLASLLWRMLRAHAIERAARRVAGTVMGDVPRVRLALSPRLWFAIFALTATTYLVHADLDHVASGRWPATIGRSAASNWWACRPRRAACRRSKSPSTSTPTASST